MMTVLFVAIVFGLPVFLLLRSGHPSKRLIEIYRRTYTRAELEQLARIGSEVARKALE